MSTVGESRREIRCGYCRGVGHNRRSCEQLVVDRNIALENSFRNSSINLNNSYCLPVDKPMTISELNTDNCDGDECPICLCSVGDKNYMIPKCGHKICCDCLFTNIKQNKTTGNLCPLCRQESIPKNVLTVRETRRPSVRNVYRAVNESEVMNATIAALDSLNYETRPLSPDPINAGERGYHFYTLLNSIRNLEVDSEIKENLEILLDNAVSIDVGYEIMHELTSNSVSNERYNMWQDNIFRIDANDDTRNEENNDENNDENNNTSLEEQLNRLIDNDEEVVDILYEMNREPDSITNIVDLV